MCRLLYVFAFAIVVVYMMPKQSHWRFQGKAPPNTTLVWYPAHRPKPGMCHLHFWGKGNVTVGKHRVEVRDHLYMFHHGALPEVEYEALSVPLKAELHLTV